MPTLSMLIRRANRAKQNGLSTTNDPMISKRTGLSSRKTYKSSNNSSAYHDLEEASRSQARLNDEPSTINIELGDIERDSSHK